MDLINKKIKERLITIKKNKIMENEKTNENNTDINKVWLFHISKRLIMELKELKNCMEIRFMIPKKFDSLIKRGKDNLDIRQNTDVIYRIDCKDCDQVYIGQTKHLETRVKEHMNNIKNSSGNYSVVTNHRLSANHDFKWDKPSILHKERNRRKREMFFIKKYKKVMGVEL